MDTIELITNETERMRLLAELRNELNKLNNDICPKCHRLILTGEIITGGSWNGEGGQHLECPKGESNA